MWDSTSYLANIRMVKAKLDDFEYFKATGFIVTLPLTGRHWANFVEQYFAFT